MYGLRRGSGTEKNQKKTLRMALPVTVREVWQYNLEEEISEIRRSLTSRRFVAIDVEFPGQVFGAKYQGYSLGFSPYQLMKANVDATEIIQLGIALCDSKGGSCCVWQFNFRDFDDRVDFQNPESIELLKRQGINFQKNRVLGIDSLDFARLIMESGLFCNSITWATFHGTYDLGYLIRTLVWEELPYELSDFMGLVKLYLGERVFDIKHMIKFCDGLHGGLEKVAKSLEVDRVAGKSHQAGSDSLLTLQTFMKLKDSRFHGCLRDDFKLAVHDLTEKDDRRRFAGIRGSAGQAQGGMCRPIRSIRPTIAPYTSLDRKTAATSF